MFLQRLLFAARGALKPAFKTIVWILKLMLPITLGVACLNYLGVIEWLSAHLAPAFRFLGLGGDAVIVFLTGALVNIYAAIAVIATLGFDFRSVTILAVMCLIAHNMIIETAIQKKTGASAVYTVVLRLAAALFAGAMLNLLLPGDLQGTLILDHITPAESPASWGAVLAGWARSIGWLSLQMTVFIFSLNILQNILREFGVIDRLTRPLRPLMKIFGLPESVSFLWIVANCVGLAYGGALMINEIERGEIGRRDARLLNAHIGVSHSLLEDTVLFATIGVGVFWLFVPRLVIATAVVWGQRFVYKTKKCTFVG